MNNVFKKFRDMVILDIKETTAHIKETIILSSYKHTNPVYHIDDHCSWPQIHKL